MVYLLAMYKVLIVDDEEIIRHGLAERVDWTSIGFTLVGACADGREAMEVAAKERPDVVLTDICMPAVDGLELALWAQEHLPLAIVVILSGYDEFEYAREAIRRNVAEYLLKPVSAKDIRSLFIRLRDRLDSGRAARDRNENLEAMAETAERLHRERSLSAFISGRLSEDGPPDRGPDPTDRGDGPPDREDDPTYGSAADKVLLPYAVLLADPSPTTEVRPRADAGAVLSSVLAALQDAGRGRLDLETFPYESDRDGGRRLAAVLAKGRDEAKLRAALGPYAELAAAKLRSIAGEDAVLAVGGIEPGVGGAALSRAEAEEALRARFLEDGDGRPIRWDALPADPGPDPRLRRASERLSLALSTSLEDALSAVADFSAGLRAASPRPDRADLEVRRLVFALLDAAESGGIPREDLRALSAIDHTKPFAGFHRLKELEEAMAAACVELSRALMERRSDPTSRRAADIRRFVADRYADTDLSTERVCTELGMSRSYVSKIMKKAFGMGFVEYLAGYRVERAKELLRSTDKKLSEIAELVGYTDHRYFGAIFKRETGMTTTEFRDAP